MRCLIFNPDDQRKAQEVLDNLLGCFRASHDNYLRDRLLPATQRAGEFALNKSRRGPQVLQYPFAGAQSVMNMNALLAILVPGDGFENSLLCLRAKAFDVSQLSRFGCGLQLFERRK